MVKIHQLAKFQPIPSMRSTENFLNPQIWPATLSQNNAKIRKKSTDSDQNLINSDGGQYTSVCQIADSSFHAFFGICPETSPDERRGRQTDGRTHGQIRVRVRVGRMDQPIHVRVEKWYFGLRMDGQLDGQTTRKHSASSAQRRMHNKNGVRYITSYNCHRIYCRYEWFDLLY